MWWLAAIACLIAALAQPKWGRIGPAPAPGHDVILLIDVSRSMGAEDAVPNRLSAAVEYAVKLVDTLGDGGPDNRAAIVAFAGKGRCYCPLTENLGAVKEILHRLRPGDIQQGGTDLGEGLEAALEAIGNDEHAEGQSIVVLSDGEDLAEQWRPRLDRLRQREVVVYAVTFGEAEKGHAVPAAAGPGVSQPMVYRGKAVETRRSDAALREIADQTGGHFIPLGLSSGDASFLYSKQIEPSARRRAQAPKIADMDDKFPLFLVSALSCLIAACWPPGRGWPWPWRLGWFWAWGWGGIRPWGWISRSGRRRRTAAALTRVAPVVASAGLVLAVGAAQPPEKATGQPEVKAHVSTSSPGTTKAARQAVSQGRAAYEKGQMEEALAAFEAAVRDAPKAAVPRFNSAAVLFRLGRFKEARSRYTEARSLADAALLTKIDYALGNTALALGDVPGAIEAYDACIASTSRGADLDVVRQDAAINRDFAYEKAQAPAIPKGPDDPSPSKRPDGRRSPDRNPGGDDPSAEGNDETNPSTDGDNPDEADQKGRDRTRRRRRAGGAGGGRTTPPGAPGESLNDRLDAALDSIRAAQSRRLPDEPPPPSPGSDGRDW